MQGERLPEGIRGRTGISDVGHWSHASGDSLWVVCVESEEVLETLEAEWMDLFARTANRNPFLSFDWMAKWWTHWGHPCRLFLVTVRDRSHRLVGLAPLYISRRGGGMGLIRRLGFIADDHVGSDHLDLLVDPGYQAAAVDAIGDVVIQRRSLWDYIEWRDTDGDAPTMQRLRCRLSRTYGMVEEAVPACLCPYLPLPKSFEEYLKELGPNQRYNFRRRWRSLERGGGVEFVTLRGGADVLAHFEELVRLHRARFSDKDHQSAFLDPTVLAFHRGVLARRSGHQWECLHLLRVNGATVAALYGFAMADKFLFYQCGMDPAWSRHSVGLVIMGLSIEASIKEGHREFDFLRGGESYKFLWTDQRRHTVTIRFFDQRFRSLCVHAYVRIRQQLALAKQGIFAAKDYNG